MDWGAFEKFHDNYLPGIGEGETKANQINTAVCKLVYKWYNDGDVFDSTYNMISGWNDISSYANWLYNYYPEVRPILDRIKTIETNEEYEQLLYDLCEYFWTDGFLEAENEKPKEGSVYDCDSPFEFVESYEEEDEDDYWNEGEDEGED
jgi:hypothetical protein